MARIWANRLEAGTQKYSEVPAKYLDQVNQYLLDDLRSGKITEEEYNNILNS